MIVSAPGLAWLPVASARSKKRGPDRFDPAEAGPTLPTRSSLQAAVGPGRRAERESFFALANELFAREGSVRELEPRWANHPDGAVVTAYRQASQELGRSKMSEMERQDRVNGTYEAIDFLLAQAPEEVADHRVTELLDRLEPTDLSIRFCLHLYRDVPCKADLAEQRLVSWGVRGKGDLAHARSVRSGVIDFTPDRPNPEVLQWLERLDELETLPRKRLEALGAEVVTELARFPYGHLDKAQELVERAGSKPALKAMFEPHREAWLGLAQSWVERGIDDRLRYTGVYGFDLYQSMAQSFPDWPVVDHLGPMLAQDFLDDGHGAKWLAQLCEQRPELLKVMNDRPRAPGAERWKLLEGAIRQGHKLDAEQKDSLLSWFYPLHQGMIHLPWDWNGQRTGSLSCLAAALPQLKECTLPDGFGGHLPVKLALREHFLSGPDADLTLAFGLGSKRDDWLEPLQQLLEHPELEEDLLCELPEKLTSGKWEELPVRTRNALALLSLRQSPAIAELVEPLLSTHQGQQDVFLAPYRARSVARRLASGTPEDLALVARMATDRRFENTLEALREHLAAMAPADQDRLADRLKLAPGSPELALAALLAGSNPRLAEGVERVLVANRQDQRLLSSELRSLMTERLAQGGPDEAHRMSVLRMLLPLDDELVSFPGLQPGPPASLTAWRTGLGGWAGEISSRLGGSDDRKLAESLEIVLAEKDPGKVGLALLEAVQAASVLRHDGNDGERFHALAQAFKEQRRGGLSVEQALGVVAPPPSLPASPGVAELEDSVVVGGTQIKRRERNQGGLS